MRNRIFSSLISTSLILSACAKTINVRSPAGEKVHSQRFASATYKAAPQSAADFNIRCIDYAAEQEVDDDSIKAWRLALAGKGDQAMQVLNNLDKKYPQMKTVFLMKGQVLNHLGYKEQAVKWYQAAVSGNEFDAINIFKLAEIQRQSGKAKDAISNYRKVLEGDPDFIPAQVGLAKTLLNVDRKSDEARKYLHTILDSDPELKNQGSIEAKELLQQVDRQNDRT